MFRISRVNCDLPAQAKNNFLRVSEINRKEGLLMGNISMTSKSSSTTTEVYPLIKKTQLKNENFFQTIKRLPENQTDLLSLAGSWKNFPDIEPAIDLIKEVVKISQEGENLSTT